MGHKGMHELLRRATIITALALICCGCTPALPETWQNHIPGRYKGARDAFFEVIEFEVNGTFRHQVFQNDKSIHVESGKWSVRSGERRIILEPFTQFYDPATQAFSTKGKPFTSYSYSPVPDGKSFYMITVGLEYGHHLARE